MSLGRYNIVGLGEMIANRARMDPYADALASTVRPGDRVLDIGTGTGIFALIACQLGAGHVWAVEPDDSIILAREMAVANGVADRITFIQALSTDVVLDEQVDVVVSDLRGCLPLFGHHLPAIIDARRRLLRPGGTLIPRRDGLWVAAVDAPERHAHHTGPWSAGPYGLDLSAGHSLAVNTWARSPVAAEQLRSEPRCWNMLDYQRLTNANVSGGATLVVTAAGPVHGLSVWFDAELADGVGFTNTPGTGLLYGQAFFPWERAVELELDDQIRVEFEADLVGDDYLWRWTTWIAAADGTERAMFIQSELYGVPMALPGIVSTGIQTVGAP